MPCLHPCSMHALVQRVFCSENIRLPFSRNISDVRALASLPFLALPWLHAKYIGVNCSTSMCAEMHSQARFAPILPFSSKVTVCAGMLLLLLIGAAALATGYVLPMKLEGIGVAEFMALDQQAVEHNRALRICQAVGLVRCVLAGALLLLLLRALSSGSTTILEGRPVLASSPDVVQRPRQAGLPNLKQGLSNGEAKLFPAPPWSLCC
uniref:Uncharacterized protein n=1 Tax=Varanus komodoensis TaxID=61221 RepID=A0A8D2L5Z5_VARKO